MYTLGAELGIARYEVSCTNVTRDVTMRVRPCGRSIGETVVHAYFINGYDWTKNEIFGMSCKKGILGKK